ncbi:MAG: RNA-directed DNA polymerase [Planctomycetaceae bacterium]|nr:RNA-directed DNA polymerase [Planctomycetaceae bacterium]
MMKLLNAVFRPDREQWQALATLLQIPEQEVRGLGDDRRLSYRPFEIARKGRRPRQILAPSAVLRQLQRRLLSAYLNCFPVHPAATAFGKGCSVAKHAAVHAGRSLILTADLQDFFESTQRTRVRRWFRQHDWSDACTQTLVWLTCFQNGLPQGAPTSPALSNLLNVPLDEQLQDLAAGSGGRYSRYCDDLAFSWNRDREPRGFRSSVDSIVRRFGYGLQSEKGWYLQSSRSPQVVTGVVISGRHLTVPR